MSVSIDWSNVILISYFRSRKRPRNDSLWYTIFRIAPKSSMFSGRRGNDNSERVRFFKTSIIGQTRYQLQTFWTIEKRRLMTQFDRMWLMEASSSHKKFVKVVRFIFDINRNELWHSCGRYFISQRNIHSTVFVRCFSILSLS